MSGKTPRELGYSMPAEWERQDAVWLAWPYDIDSFPVLEGAERSQAEVIAALSEGEMVHLLVRDEAMLSRAAQYLKLTEVDAANVTFHTANYADVWFRDMGPTFVVNREERKLAMVDWDFNAYGKFPELLNDSLIPKWMNEFLKLPRFEPGIVLEGGSIDVNGAGTLLTTEQCLLNPNRNPSLKKEEIEKYLKDYLGVRKIIWLKQGILEDHTDGHIDDIARFVDPKTILCCYEEDPADGNFPILRENYEILQKETDQDGRPFELVRLPMPKKFHDARRIPVSYANFYIGNSVVAVPTFKDPRDGEALRIIRSLFPTRRTIGIDSSDFIFGGGTIHCATQQQPGA